MMTNPIDYAALALDCDAVALAAELAQYEVKP